MADAPNRPIVASYRLQLTPTFGFAEVIDLLEPIAALGVSHLYLSPIAEAVTGSLHGYDVVDHRRVRAEFGGWTGLTALLDAALDHELGVIIDHVPNHVSVAAAEQNPRWWQLLQEGPHSEAARWFDVDWELTDGKVVVPRLGAPLDETLANGLITIGSGPRGAELRYGSLQFPMAEGTADLPLPDALGAQHYELQYWKAPRRNVRRFFTIDDLAAVRVEHPEVVEEVDTLPRELSDHPAFAGVRVDHVDGLADPGGYLEQLRATIGARWLLVEKILGPGEVLPAGWPVDGTTGYEHITAAEHFLVDPAGEGPLDGWWRDLVASGSDQRPAAFQDLEDEARREVLAAGLKPDLDRLLRLIGSRGAREVGRAAVVELTLALDRYRTYLPDDDLSMGVLGAAVDDAARRRPDLDEELRQLALLVSTDDAVQTRWQQLTSPVMAKGAEDRAFYRHLRLAALCEVGGSPGSWSLDAHAFHDHQARVQATWPATMLTSTTHDTKRSQAVRARSLALASDAERWVALGRRWLLDLGNEVGGLRPSDVSLALQTVVTAQPLDAERLTAYLVKAAREADLDTSWIEPDDAYEAALGRLAVALSDQARDPESELGQWADSLAEAGAAIGRRLLALQLTCPGVPDLYQGAPFELTSLVDPDNRRVPDWDLWRRAVTADLDEWPAGLGEADRRSIDLCRRLLAMRRRQDGAFGPDGGYQPIGVTGSAAAHVLAYGRTDHRGVAVAVIVTRALAADEDWGSTEVELPPGRWRRLSDGKTLDGGSVSDLCVDGLAVLERTG